MEVHLLIHAPEGQHRAFKKAITEKKYPFEGKARKGYCKPFISETKFYTLKAKKEVMPQVLADIKASTTCIGAHECGYRPVQRSVNMIDRGIGWMIKLTNLMFRLKLKWKRIRTRTPLPEYNNEKLIPIDMTKIPKGQDLSIGWLYSKVLFGHTDPITDGEEAL